MDATDRERTLAYFERLGRDRVRLYTAIDCDRWLGDWQVRELADEWLEAKRAEAANGSFWRRIIGARR